MSIWMCSLYDVTSTTVAKTRYFSDFLSKHANLCKHQKSESMHCARSLTAKSAIYMKKSWMRSSLLILG